MFLSFLPRRPALLILPALLAALPGLALAQAQPRVPPAMQQDLETLQRYADEVNRRSQGGRGGPPPAAPAASPTPAPAAPAAQAGSERDPFEVSPQLRESSLRNRPGSTLGGAGGAINRHLRIRAMARGPEGGIAQLEAGKEVVTVRDGDELVVDGIPYTVHVERDGLLLRGSAAPQFRMLVR